MAQEPELVVLPRESVEELAHILTLFDECATWGELRAKASPERYTEILGMAGYGEFAEYAAHLLIGREIPGALADAATEFDPDQRPPGDQEPFQPSNQIAAVADGDYPPDPRYLMNLEVPGDIIEAHGERFETVFNGVYARFPAAAADSVVGELERRGHSCTEDPGQLSRCFQT